MTILQNTLYVTQRDAYLSLQNENVVIKHNNAVLTTIPLHNIQAICSFSYIGISSKLLIACAKRNIIVNFLHHNGDFLARLTGSTYGNVLVKKEQALRSEDPNFCKTIACSMIQAKIHNQLTMYRRFIRNHPVRFHEPELNLTFSKMKAYQQALTDARHVNSVRGIEGIAASHYFSIFNHFILNQRETFQFNGRNRRPPKDIVNAMLSFGYTLLKNEMMAALESNSLDPYVGFLHKDRPGKPSLALDLMEDLRGVMVDKLVLSLINKHIFTADHFTLHDGVVINDEGRKIFLYAWQQQKQRIVTHPFTSDKMPWGLVPFTQAALLNKHLRGELDGYPPFIWR